MNRREFLKITVLSAGGLVLPSLSVACGATATVVAKTVGEYFVAFALAVGSQLVANRFEDWFQELSQADRSYVDEKTRIMVEDGFVYNNTPVYNYDKIIFYGAENVDAFNTCAPFFSSEGTPLVEGPALIGMSLASQNWSSGKGKAGDGLIPLRAYQSDGSQFEASTKEPLKYKTPSGTLEMSYTADNERKQGLISVVSKHDNGGLLHGQDYEISWA